MTAYVDGCAYAYIDAYIHTWTRACVHVFAHAYVHAFVRERDDDNVTGAHYTRKRLHLGVMFYRTYEKSISG